MGETCPTPGLNLSCMGPLEVGLIIAAILLGTALLVVLVGSLVANWQFIKERLVSHKFHLLGWDAKTDAELTAARKAKAEKEQCKRTIPGIMWVMAACVVLLGIAVVILASSS